MIQNLYGPQAQSYKQLPHDQIDRKASELERVIQLWCGNLKKSLSGPVEIVDVYTCALKPYSSSKKVRSALVDAVLDPNIHYYTWDIPYYCTSRAFHEVLAPWRGLDESVSQAITKSFKAETLTSLYFPITAYEKISKNELDVFSDNSKQGIKNQKALLSTRACDIVCSDQDVLNILIYIAFNLGNDYNPEVKHTAQGIFQYLIDQNSDKAIKPESTIPEDNLFKLRVARGIKNICEQHVLELPQDFVDSLLRELYKEEWLKAAPLHEVKLIFPHFVGEKDITSMPYAARICSTQ